MNYRDCDGYCSIAKQSISRVQIPGIISNGIAIAGGVESDYAARMAYANKIIRGYIYYKPLALTTRLDLTLSAFLVELLLICDEQEIDFDVIMDSAAGQYMAATIELEAI